MIKIRITGLPDDIESFLSYIRKHFFISKESKVYKDSNSKFSRKYVEVSEKGGAGKMTTVFNVSTKLK